MLKFSIFGMVMTELLLSSDFQRVYVSKIFFPKLIQTSVKVVYNSSSIVKFPSELTILLIPLDQAKVSAVYKVMKN